MKILFSALFLSVCELLLAQNPIFFGQNRHITTTGLATLPPSSGMVFWVSADCITKSGSCAVPSNGSTVTSWADQSGNSNNLTSTTGTATYQANSVGSTGQPTIYCNHCGFSLTATIAATNTVSEFVVMKTPGIDNYTFSLTCDTGQGCFQYSSCTACGTQSSAQIPNVASAPGGTATGNTTAFHQMNVTWDHSTITYRLNRASDGGGSFTSTASQGWAYAFQTVSPFTATFQMYVAEVIVYNRVLTSTEITTVETYLYTKYGL